MATWPLTLQQKVEASQFELVFGETRIKSNVDVGPVKVRSRFTDAVDQYRAAIFLDSAEYDDLRTFYKTTLNNGTDYFTWVDPIDSSAASFRFISPPRISSMGGAKFTVSLALERLP
jgi:hypothetical protein